MNPKRTMPRPTEQEVKKAIDGVKSLIAKAASESDLAGYAFQEAAIKIGDNWTDALGDGYEGNLIKDVDEVVAKLQSFQEKARAFLPIQNGGFGGTAKSVWIEKLSLNEIFIYEAEDLPGHYGFTGCNADQYMSFDEALHAALAANPDIALENTKDICFSNIKWDADPISMKRLPKTIEMKVEIDCDIDLEGADLLSDKFGFCVHTFEWENISATEDAAPTPRG